MAEIRDVRYRLTADTRDAERNLKSFGTSFTEINQGLELVAKGFDLLSGVAGQTFEALDRGGVVTNVTRGFENLQRQAGLLADTSLQNLRAATQGVVSDFELMQQANQAVQLGLDPAALDEYAAAATKLGAVVGRDASEAFADLITGVGRASPLILDNLGITLKAEEAYALYAEQLGETVKELSSAEKALAFQEAALEKIRQKAAQLPEVQLNAAQAADVLTASATNAFDEFTRGLTSSDNLARALQTMADVLKGVDFETIGRELGEFLGDVTRGAAIIGEFVKELAGISDQFDTSFIKSVDQADAAYRKLFDDGEKLKNQIAILSGRYEEFTDVQKRWDDGAIALGKTLKEKRAALEENQKQIDAVTDKSQKLKDVSDLLSGQQGGGGIEGVAVAAESTGKELDALRGKYDDLLRDLERKDLRQGFDRAVDSLNRADFETFKNKLVEAEVEALKESLQGLSPSEIENASQKLSESLTRGYEDEFAEAARTNAEKQADELKDALAESADFWSDIFSQALGDIDLGGFERTISQLGGQLVSGLLPAGDSLGGLGGLFGLPGGGSFDIGGLFGGGAQGPLTPGQSALSNLGINPSSLIGLEGVASSLGIGAAISTNLGNIGGLLSGSPRGIGSAVGGGLGTAAGAIFGGPIGAGLGSLAGDFLGGALGGAFGGSKDADQIAREEIRSALADALGEDTLRNLRLPFGGRRDFFDVDFAQASVGAQQADPQLAQGVGLTSGLAFGLAGGGKEGEDFNAIFGQIASGFQDGESAASSFNEVFVNTLSLFDQLGTNAQEQKVNITQAFLDGQLSLAEFGQGLQSLNTLAQENLVGEGSVIEALKITAETIDTDPRTALKGLELALIEMGEIGVASFEGLADYTSDRFGPDVSNAFRALSAAGINSLEDLRNVGGDQIFAIINALQPVADELIGTFADSEDEIRRSSDEATAAVVRNNEQKASSYRRVAEEASRAASKAQEFISSAREAQSVSLDTALEG